MTYRLTYKQSAQDDIAKLPLTVRRTVRQAIEARIATDPIQYGKPLHFSLKGHRRIRVGDYRIIYRVDEETKSVYIVPIGHRKDIYED